MECRPALNGRDDCCDFRVDMACARGKINNPPNLPASRGIKDREMKNLRDEYEIEIVAAHNLAHVPKRIGEDNTNRRENLWIGARLESPRVVSRYRKETNPECVADGWVERLE